MRRVRLSSSFCLLVSTALACSTEAPSASAPSVQSTRTTTVPDGWATGTSSVLYSVGTSTESHGGKHAAYLSGVVGSATQYAVIYQNISATAYIGKRIRMSAWVRSTRAVPHLYSGIWLAVDGPGVREGEDDMVDRPVTGTTDWHQVSIVADVPANASGIQMGGVFDGDGELLIDDVSLEVVDNSVKTTVAVNSLPATADSTYYAGRYGRTTSAPVDGDFEGLASVASNATVAWLTANMIKLTSTDPTASLDDLVPLESLVGDAHIVGLGEGTHGTREFFQMKHRILEDLVAHKGFNVFAIEASTPEAEDINRYVLTGQGNPQSLVEYMYFWTWNTQEVVDLVAWIRNWNSQAAPDKRVQFRGVDMQSPGASIDSVASYFARVDPANATLVSDGYVCLAPYRNHRQVLGMPVPWFTDQQQTVKDDCAAHVEKVRATIAAKRDAYTRASTSDEYEMALHHARLVQQWVRSASSATGAYRDSAMAENAVWVRDHSGANTRVALWAHNGHVNTRPGAMGGYLRSWLGDDYRAVGQTMGDGGFNAVKLPSGGVTPFQFDAAPSWSLESIFIAANASLAMLDTRRIVSGGSAAAAIAGPIPMRDVGSGYDPQQPTAWFTSRKLPDDFDVLIFTPHGHSSTLLPFSYP